jgi:hypothetical protein
LSIRIVKDEKEFYKEYKNQLREQSKIAISIQGVSDEDKTRIENALQELITAQVINQAYDEVRAIGISNEFLDESDLQTSLRDLPLPESDIRILEAKTRQLARQMMLPPRDGGDGGPKDGNQRPPSGTILQASHSSGHICICMAAGIPGSTLSLAGLNPLPQGNLLLSVRFSTGDLLRLLVEPGAPFGIGANQTQVGLASSVSWAKEIVAWNLCRGRLSSVFQATTNSTPTFMLLQRGCDGADTIIFRKPGFLGIWYDIGHFDDRLFWTVFGGRRLTFTWLVE